MIDLQILRNQLLGENKECGTNLIKFTSQNKHPLILTYHEPSNMAICLTSNTRQDNEKELITTLNKETAKLRQTRKLETKKEKRRYFEELKQILEENIAPEKQMTAVPCFVEQKYGETYIVKITTLGGVAYSFKIISQNNMKAPVDKIIARPEDGKTRVDKFIAAMDQKEPVVLHPYYFYYI